jgi:hypothetical protein
MTRSTPIIGLAALIAGALAASIVNSPLIPMSTTKSDRLDGPQTETAFLPERFGVPGSRQ